MWWTEFIPLEKQPQIKMHNFPLHHFAPYFLFEVFLLVFYTFKISPVLASSHSVTAPSI